jgi:hypothetical protein
VACRPPHRCAAVHALRLHANTHARERGAGLRLEPSHPLQVRGPAAGEFLLLLGFSFLPAAPLVSVPALSVRLALRRAMAPRRRGACPAAAVFVAAVVAVGFAAEAADMVQERLTVGMTIVADAASTGAGKSTPLPFNFSRSFVPVAMGVRACVSPAARDVIRRASFLFYYRSQCASTGARRRTTCTAAPAPARAAGCSSSRAAAGATTCGRAPRGPGRAGDPPAS